MQVILTQSEVKEIKDLLQQTVERQQAAMEVTSGRDSSEQLFLERLYLALDSLSLDS